MKLKKYLILSFVCLFFVGCCFVDFGDPYFWNDDAFTLDKISAEVGDDIAIMIDVSCLSSGYDAGDDYLTHCWFYGLSAEDPDNLLFSASSLHYVGVSLFNTAGDHTFTVPPKAVTSRIHGKILQIEYPKILTCKKEGDKVTVTSEMEFFNTNCFCKEKAKLLLDNGYPLIWLEGENPDAKSSVLDNMSPLEGSENYDLGTITPYQVTFTIPSWFKGGNVHIVNENGYVNGVSWLEDTKIAEDDFNGILANENISEEDKNFLKGKYYQEKDGSYYLSYENEKGENRHNVRKSIIRILRQADYYDSHIVNIEPDPDERHAFFASKEKLTIN